MLKVHMAAVKKGLLTFRILMRYVLYVLRIENVSKMGEEKKGWMSQIDVSYI